MPSLRDGRFVDDGRRVRPGNGERALESDTFSRVSAVLPRGVAHRRALGDDEIATAGVRATRREPKPASKRRLSSSFTEVNEASRSILRRTPHARCGDDANEPARSEERRGRATDARRCSRRVARSGFSTTFFFQERTTIVCVQPVTDPQTGVAQDSLVTRAAICVRLVDVRITCGLHDDAQLAAVFIDPRAK